MSPTHIQIKKPRTHFLQNAQKGRIRAQIITLCGIDVIHLRAILEPMDPLPFLQELEQYVADSTTINQRDQTVLHTKLLQLRIRVEGMIETNKTDKERLVTKLKKKTKDHELSQKLLTLVQTV